MLCVSILTRPLWGNANNWGNTARSLGIAVDNARQEGCIRFSPAFRVISNWSQVGEQHPTTARGISSGVSYNGLTAGWNYCYSVRAHNRAGQSSKWSVARCVARPLDDTSLSVSAGWARQSSAAYYGGSLLSTSRLNATVSRSGAVIDRVGLVATTCPNCGTVGVYVNGGLFRTVRLTSTVLRHGVLIVLPAFSLRTATITVKVLTSGRTVQIDGLALGRS
jgi:hypothetical protein